VISFVIPTNNRAKELEVCIRSIADQIMQFPTEANIIVIDDGCTDNTPELVEQLGEQYGCITYCRYDKHKDYSDVFRTMFCIAPEETEWVWTFGDDDQLQKGALKFILAQLKAEETHENPAVFFHIAEAARASGRSGAFRGAMLDIAQNFGLIEMTGFITGNICRKSHLAAAADTPRWNEYAKSAFVQSFALFEHLQHDQMVFLDIPLIATQYADQNEETQKRWARDNISYRYLYTVTAMQRMYDDGILTAKLNPKFFRYLSYHLWDRFIHYYTGDYLAYERMWPQEAWAMIGKFADFLNDDEAANKLRQTVEAVSGMITLHMFMKKNLDGIYLEIKSVSEQHGTACYPWHFVEPLLAEAPSINQ